MSRNQNTGTGNRKWGYFWPSVTPDLARDLEYIAEWHEQHMPIIPYYRLLTEQVELDPVHQEIEQHLKTFDEPLELVTFVSTNTTEKVLALYGIDEKRDITLISSIVKLMDVGLAVLSDPKIPISDPIIYVKPGDRFIYDDDWYRVLSLHQQKYHSNFNYPFYVAIPAEKLRSDSLGYPSPVTCGEEEGSG